MKKKKKRENKRGRWRGGGPVATGRGERGKASCVDSLLDGDSLLPEISPDLPSLFFFVRLESSCRGCT